MPSAQADGGQTAVPSGPWGRRFAFVALLSMLVVAVALTPGRIMRPLLDGTAAITAALLGILGIESSTVGNSIDLSSRTLLITRDCTGIYLIAVYVALVVTYPASNRQRLLALVTGLPVLLVLNMARLVGAGIVAQVWPDAFETLHDYVFQIGLMLAVLFMWFVWTGRLRARSPDS